MRDIAIPPDTEEKVAEAICDAEFWPGTWASLDKESNEVVVYRKQARAACLAMLKAWPGVHEVDHRVTAQDEVVSFSVVLPIILPLLEKETSA